MTYKNRLQSLVFKYQQRRAALRAQYKATGWNKNPEYTRRAKRIRLQIRNYQKRINRIEKNFQRLDVLHAQVCEFSGVETVRNTTNLRYNPYCGQCAQNRTVRGRTLFYKYALEQRITPLYISEYMGCGRNTPRQTRQRFTKSFTSHTDNYFLWKSFQQYLMHRQIPQATTALRA